MSNGTSVELPAVKVASAWAAVGITSWADAAAAMAFVYSVALFGEWLWKKILRPLCERRGWLQRRKRRMEDLP